MASCCTVNRLFSPPPCGKTYHLETDTAAVDPVQIGDCAHMTCEVCYKHWCWICREVFETEDECYEHLDTYEMEKGTVDPYCVDNDMELEPHEGDVVV